MFKSLLHLQSTTDITMLASWLQYKVKDGKYANELGVIANSTWNSYGWLYNKWNEIKNDLVFNWDGGTYTIYESNKVTYQVPEGMPVEECINQYDHA